MRVIGAIEGMSRPEQAVAQARRSNPDAAVDCATPPMAPLIEARVGLDEAPETFRRLASGALPADKILVHPSASEGFTP